MPWWLSCPFKNALAVNTLVHALYRKGAEDMDSDGLISQARWFIYSEHAMPMSIFQDGYFLIQCCRFTVRAKVSRSTMTAPKLKRYIDAEYTVMIRGIGELLVTHKDRTRSREAESGAAAARCSHNVQPEQVGVRRVDSAVLQRCLRIKLISKTCSGFGARCTRSRLCWQKAYTEFGVVEAVDDDNGEMREPGFVKTLKELNHFSEKKTKISNKTLARSRRFSPSHKVGEYVGDHQVVCR